MASELDRPMHKDDRPKTTGQLMKSMRKLGDYDLEVDGDLPFEFGSKGELDAFELLKKKGTGYAFFEKAGDFWQLACLRARKYNVDRAFELVLAYMKWRADFGVDTTTVSTDPEYKALVERGVVAAFGNYDKSGRFVITVQMKKTDPGRWSPRHAILATHAAVESVLLRYPAAQARGIAFVNDMSAVCLGNMDSRVPREMFAAFGSKLPVRFGGLYVVNPPFFLRMMAPVIKMFMSKKMQRRIQLLPGGYKDLKQHFDNDQIPEAFEGAMPDRHPEYLAFVDKMQGEYGHKRTLTGELQRPSSSQSSRSGRSSLSKSSSRLAFV